MATTSKTYTAVTRKVTLPGGEVGTQTVTAGGKVTTRDSSGAVVLSYGGADTVKAGVRVSGTTQGTYQATPENANAYVQQQGQAIDEQIRVEQATKAANALLNPTKPTTPTQPLQQARTGTAYDIVGQSNYATAGMQRAEGLFPGLRPVLETQQGIKEAGGIPQYTTKKATEKFIAEEQRKFLLKEEPKIYREKRNVSNLIEADIAAGATASDITSKYSTMISGLETTQQERINLFQSQTQTKANMFAGEFYEKNFASKERLKLGLLPEEEIYTTTLKMNGKTTTFNEPKSQALYGHTATEGFIDYINQSPAERIGISLPKVKIPYINQEVSIADFTTLGLITTGKPSTIAGVAATGFGAVKLPGIVSTFVKAPFANVPTTAVTVAKTIGVTAGGLAIYKGTMAIAESTRLTTTGQQEILSTAKGRKDIEEAIGIGRQAMINREEQMSKRPTGNGILKDLSLRFGSGGYREKSFEFSVRQVLSEKGYIGGQLEEGVALARQRRTAMDLGTLGGLVTVQAGTEIGGRLAIEGIKSKGIKIALTKGLSKAQVTSFVFEGSKRIAQEGFAEGAATSVLLNEGGMARYSVIQNPLTFGFGGSVTAGYVGGKIIQLSATKPLRGKALLGGAYVTDTGEAMGDTLADIAFRVSGKTSKSSSRVFTATNTFTTTSTNINTKSRTSLSTFTQSFVPSNVVVTTPSNIMVNRPKQRVPTTVNINTAISPRVMSNVPININTPINTNVPVNVNVPINTNVPVSVNVPINTNVPVNINTPVIVPTFDFPLPLMPYGGGGSSFGLGGGRQRRKTAYQKSLASSEKIFRKLFKKDIVTSKTKTLTGLFELRI